MATTELSAYPPDGFEPRLIERYVSDGQPVGSRALSRHSGLDLSPATVAAIRGGWTDVVLDQQPYLQGYLPILQICLTKVYGFAGLHIDTGGGFADKANIEFLAPLAEKEIR